VSTSFLEARMIAWAEQAVAAIAALEVMGGRGDIDAVIIRASGFRHLLAAGERLDVSIREYLSEPRDPGVNAPVAGG